MLRGVTHILLGITAATEGDISSSWQLLEEQKLLSGHVTFGSDASSSLLHPSACPVPLSGLCLCRESHLRTDLSEIEGQHPNEAFFQCVYLQIRRVPWPGLPTCWHSRGERIAALLEQTTQTLQRVGRAPALALAPSPGVMDCHITAKQCWRKDINTFPLCPIECAQKQYSACLQRYCIIISSNETLFLFAYNFLDLLNFRKKIPTSQRMMAFLLVFFPPGCEPIQPYSS